MQPSLKMLANLNTQKETRWENLGKTSMNITQYTTEHPNWTNEANLINRLEFMFNHIHNDPREFENILRAFLKGR